MYILLYHGRFQHLSKDGQKTQTACGLTVDPLGTSETPYEVGLVPICPKCLKTSKGEGQK